MYILGISAFYHDSAAALIKDGRIVRAAAEERFSRIKHDNAFPLRAIAWCLQAEGIDISDVAILSYYEKPLRKFERILDTLVRTFPLSLKAFMDSMPEWLGAKIRIEHIIRKELGFAGELQFVPHHASHAALAFYGSGFPDAAVVVLDGVGEYRTTSLWHGRGMELKEIAGIDFPHSLGLFYSTVTSFLGFRVNEDESKVMGLAAHGTPRFADALRKVVRLKSDGSFSLDMRYFSFEWRSRMWSHRLVRLLGKPRTPSMEIDARTVDIAASLQKVLTEAYLKLADAALSRTGSRNICLAGGVALNASANGALTKHLGHSRLFIPGPAGDDGAAAGAALYTHHAQEGANRSPRISTLALGSEHSDDSIIKEISARSLTYVRPLDTTALLALVADALASDHIVGWFQGAMEYGPRALGSRSILADPRDTKMRARVNALKGRDEAHPCAASVRAQRMSAFDIADPAPYAHMTVCAPVPVKLAAQVPAIVHQDGTCRLHTTEVGLYAALIEQFEERAGVPCILNTSFNARGEPIVESPAQALDTFLKMRDMRHLVIGSYIVSAPRTE